MKRILVASLVSLGLVMAISGCAGRPAPSVDPGAESTGQSAVASPSATPSRTFDSATIAGDYELCTSLLDASFVAALKKQGLTEVGADYTKNALLGYEFDSGDPHPVRFVPLGGIVCKWSAPDDAGGVGFAYGPITAEQAVIEKDLLVSQGSKRIEGSNIERYSEPFGYSGGVVFGDGYWAYAWAWDKANDPLDQIIKNAPAF